jgi:hypothetical protein
LIVASGYAFLNAASIAAGSAGPAAAFEADVLGVAGFVACARMPGMATSAHPTPTRIAIAEFLMILLVGPCDFTREESSERQMTGG